MFSKACGIASNFTGVAIISTRLFDKTVNCGCGAYIVINDEGWILTVAHLWNSRFAYQKHSTELSVYKKEIISIQQDPNLSEVVKRHKIKGIKNNPKWITNHSFWWGFDGVKVIDVKPLPEGDLVIGRLDPFDPNMVKNYPVFKDPSKLAIGTSLCKLGYPFHKINATYNEATAMFTLAPGSLPLPRFPNDGIYTRNIIGGRSKDKKYGIKFLETSSPGLKGQSGGPIFDKKGTVWAVQSRTSSLLLGFNPKVLKNGKEIEENQFLNTGWGVHPELIVAFLKDNGINFKLSSY
jgi:hypothetical protein